MLKSAANDFRQHVPMSAVDPVEVADSHDRWPWDRRAEARRNLAELAEDLHLKFELQLEAVISELHAGRKAAVGHLVGQVVADVGEECLLGF